MTAARPHGHPPVGFPRSHGQATQTVSVDALDRRTPGIDAFLCDFAKRMRCDEPMTNRLRAVAEEAVHTLLGDGESSHDRDLLLVARADGRSADLEFIAGGAEANLEEQLAMLSEGVTGLPNEAEMPLRLLRHYATAVRHQQYHDTDIVTFRVEPRGSG